MLKQNQKENRSLPLGTYISVEGENKKLIIQINIQLNPESIPRERQVPWKHILIVTHFPLYYLEARGSPEKGAIS